MSPDTYYLKNYFKNIYVYIIYIRVFGKSPAVLWEVIYIFFSFSSPESLPEVLQAIFWTSHNVYIFSTTVYIGEEETHIAYTSHNDELLLIALPGKW